MIAFCWFKRYCSGQVKTPGLFSRAVGLRQSRPADDKRDSASTPAQTNGAAPVDMRMIDIFVSAPADVQKEQAIAEQLIRSTAAEFNLPINVSYSNPLRRSSKDSSSVDGEGLPDKSNPVLSPCFWEHLDSEENKFLEQIPNTGLYDLVICILWSQLGSTLPPECVMPDGSRPRSATDYQVAWALHQSRQTPGSPDLLVYRSRATAAAPLEPKEQRENFFWQWDAVQDFCGEWEKNAGTGFRECCYDFRDLDEFEALFRNHFRKFLARRLDPDIAPGKPSLEAPYSGSNPFRGLNFFDCEHSALYHGRTRAIGELFDVLKKQAAAKNPILLVLGPSGSGKSSLARAGVLPILIRGGTAAGTGPWRRALTRPGAAGDPFDALADALLEKSAVPEIQHVTSPEESWDLASQLRKDPEGVAARLRKVMDQLSGQEFDHHLADGKEDGLPAKESENVETTEATGLAQVKPMTQLALVVDQLEELFTRFSPGIQQKYIAALCALANCRRVIIIATLGSDFYPHYQRFSEITALTERYDLQPPTLGEIGNIIRFRTEAAGLHFERDPETNRSLDETIIKAAVATPEPLPLLEHLLSRLYERQLTRNDGWLLWDDYRVLGGFQDALAQHAEFVFLNLKSDEQQVLGFVIRNLLVRSRGEEDFFNRRCVPYRDLVSSPELSQRQRAGAEGLVERLIAEGLLSVETNPQQERLISIPQEVMLRRWPRLWGLLSEDRHFLRMRERLDADFSVWITRGRQREDLLDRGIGLAEAQTLLSDSRTQLNETQIDYIQKSLARHKPPPKVLRKIGSAAAIALALFVAFAGGEQFNGKARRIDKEQNAKVRQQNAGFADNQRSELEAQLGTLEIRLKETEQRLEIAQKSADRANNQRSELETTLKKAQDEKAQLAQQNTDLVNSKPAQLEIQQSLKAQLKETEEKLQLAQQNADPANSQRSQLEAELNKAQDEKTQLAQQNTNLVNSQRAELEAQQSLEAQLKKTEEKDELAQRNADLANGQLSQLEAELKKAQDEKVQLTQQNINLADSQRAQLENQQRLEVQLKQTQETLQVAQKSADLADSQRNALETQLKATEEKLRIAQQDAEMDNRQRSELETRLKNEQAKLQNGQVNPNPLTGQLQAARIGTVTLFGNETDSDEKQEGAQIERYAVLNLPQEASPTAQPSPTAESEIPKSSESQSVQTEDSAEEEPSVRHPRHHLSRYWRHSTIHSRRKYIATTYTRPERRSTSSGR